MSTDDLVKRVEHAEQLALWDLRVWEYGEEPDPELRSESFRRQFLESSLAYGRTLRPTAKQLVNHSLSAWRLAVRISGLEPVVSVCFKDTRCDALPEWCDVRLLQPMFDEALCLLSPLTMLVMGGRTPVGS